VKTILLVGKNGQVGWELERTLLPLGRVIALDRTQMDLTQPDAIRRTVRQYSPDIIVNAAGYTAVDKAEKEPDLAMQVNAVAPGILAEESTRLNALLVHYSTDYVFDGTRSAPYTEEDEPNPVNVYGKSKLEGERAITATGCFHLILRTSWIYSARGTNFVFTMLRLARAQAEVLVVDDQIGSPTAARELSKVTSEILGKFRDSQAHKGVFHLSASGYCSRFEFAKAIIETAKKISGTQSGWADVRATKTQHFPLPAARPLNASTSKEKITRAFGSQMMKWNEQLDDYLGEILSTAIR
jgi:dTDP-4-dehydrorhamnose reductase